MPGKYSHSVVLAQYSSRGIISLPNDQQLAYDKKELSTKPISKPTTRSRAQSIATTNSSGLPPLSEQPWQSPYSSSQYGQSTGRLGSMSTTSKRRVILDSDSDSESDHVVSYQRDTRPVVYHHPEPINAPYGRQARQTLPEPRSDGGARQSAATHLRSKPGFDQSSNVSARPALRNAESSGSRRGVESLVDSRYQQGTQVQVRTEAGDEQVISLKEFVDTMPEANKWVTPPSSRDQSVLKQDRGFQPHGPLQRQRSDNTTKTQIYDPQPVDSVLDFDGFSDGDDIEPDFMRNLTVPSKASGMNKPKMQAAEPRKTVGHSEIVRESPRPDSLATQTTDEDTQFQPSFNATTLLRERRSQREVLPAAPQKIQREESRSRSMTTKQQRPSMMEDLIPPPTLSRLDHYSPSDGNSSVSSFSDFGRPSVSRTTMTSKSTHLAPKSPKPNVSEMDWTLPEIDRHKDFHSSMFDESENESIISRVGSSAPHQGLGVDLPKSHWGQVSSGRDVMPATDDTMSELSAACPPDIGRYKYGSGSEGPLAQLEKIVTEHKQDDGGRNVNRRSAETKTTAEPSEERERRRKSTGGFLSKFRRKSQALSDKGGGAKA